MNIELKLDYISPNFGKKNNRGEYDIRSDYKKYILYVNNIPVVDISIEYERFTSTSPNYACCYISYNNKFFNKDDNYTNKGYTTKALQLVTEMLLKEGNVPRISLDILPDNEPSKKVASKVGYIFINNNNYSIYHPNAIKMYEEGLSYLKEDDYDIYELQMERALMFYKKYIETKQEQQGTKFSM